MANNSLCLVATALIPIWSAPSLGNESSLEKFFSIFLVVLVVAMILVTFGNFAYSIYGIIGAILTYQGKTFRYLIIGKQIEKRNRK